MLTNKITDSTLTERSDSFKAAFVALKKMKSSRLHVRSHRAIRQITLDPYLIAQTIGLPFLFYGILLFIEPYFIAFWCNYLLFWISQFNIPLSLNFHATTIGEMNLNWLLEEDENSSIIPSRTMLVIYIMITFAFFISSFFMKNEKTPLKYLSRILCTIQGISILFFWLQPAEFPYTIPEHLTNILYSGYYLILSIPLILGIGYYVFNINIITKISYTMIILFFFLLLVPHLAILHALILQHLSLLFMPLLYICFGGVLNVLIFIALYSWIISTIPAHAVT